MNIDDIVQDFGKDAGKESGGVWVQYRRCKYLIARAHRNNAKFAAVMEKKARPYQVFIARGDYESLKNVAGDMMQEVYAESILLGIEGPDGQKLDYTAADGLELFKKLPDLWDFVYEIAKTGEYYAPDVVEADSKN